jgi:hypothetical protein
MEAFRESGYSSITDIPFGLGQRDGWITAETRTIYPARVWLLMKPAEVQQQ